MFLTDSTSTFLAARPEWTLNGAVFSFGEGSRHAIEQTDFRMIDGFWEAEAVLTSGEAEDVPPTRVVLRVTPETLRRWKEARINPFLEACAQLHEHLRFHTRHNHLTALRLL